MVRKAEGQVDGRMSRAARVLRSAALATLAIGASGAIAAEVAEVRVGTHEKSSRIVVELDQASGYQLVTPQDGSSELLIHLDAASIARDVPSKSPVVRKVEVEPRGNGSTVRVRLATANVAVKELLLANPPRLVFDLTAQGPIPKAPVEEEVVEASPAPAAEIAGQDEEPAPAPEPAKPIVVAAAEPAPAPEPMPVANATPEAPIAAEPPAPVVPPAPPVEVAKPIVRDAAPSAPSEAASSFSAEARRKALAEKAKQETTTARPSGDSLLALAMSPVGLGAIGAAVLVLGTIVVMRRRRSNDDEDPLYTVMSADDASEAADYDAAQNEEAEPVRAAPIWEPDAFEASEPTPKLGPHQLSLGSRSAPEPEAVLAQSEIEPPDDSDSIFGGEPEPEPVAVAEPIAPSATAPMPGHVTAPMIAPMSDETERRIVELERRIEQLAEARERLERQVAAQTEELRVQRAAIARTQRVVRSIAKTEDMATEPVPRAPSIS